MRCYLCKSKKIKMISGKLRYKSRSKAYECLNCGLVFLYPGMTGAEENKFYQKEYGNIFAKEKGTTPEKLFKSRQRDAAAYYDFVKGHIGKSDRCLEIGCASGYFLAKIKNKVKNVCGIESHALLRDYCLKLGIPVFDSLEKVKNEKFDAIFMFFVLEHFSDPVKSLLAAKKLLKKGGRLFIEVPNVQDALISLYGIGSFKKYYYTPAHPFYYTKNTLSLLLKKAGFNKPVIKFIQRYDISNHLFWMINGKPGGAGKFADILGHSPDREYKKALVKEGISDTLFAIAVR